MKISKLITISCLLTVMSGCAPTSPSLHKKIQALDSDGAINLIARQKDIDTYSESGSTPLHLAVVTRQFDVVHALVEAGADINARTIDGNTPLALAASSNQIEVAKLLLDHGASISSVTRGKGALAGSMEKGSVEIIRLLLDAGAPVNYRDHSGATALFYAAYLGRADVVELLLDHGAEVNSATLDGRTPLHAAIYRKNYDVAQMLIDEGAEPAGTDKSEQGVYSSALVFEHFATLAARVGDEDLAQQQLQQAKKYYGMSSDKFTLKARELGEDIGDQKLASVASVVFAGLAAGYQASISDSGIGVSQYRIRDTSSLEELQSRYMDLAQYCKNKAGEIDRIVECSKASANRLPACISLQGME